MNIILFHDFKHHLQTNKNWLDENRSKWDAEIHKRVKTIGNSQLDYYVGQLSAEDIRTEILNFLIENNLTEKQVYLKWMEDNGGFREINLSDSSRWTLRYLEEAEFVHLHPSRYSMNTVRVKANALKSVLCSLLFQETNNFEFDIEQVNGFRTEFMELSPISAKADHSELKKVFELFKD